MIKFRTAYSITLIILVSISLLGTLVGCLIGELFGASVLILVIMLLFFYGANNTYYVVNSSQKSLIILSGLFFKKSIEIDSIKRVEDSNSLLSAPAMSMKRLEIIYNKFDSILISPKDKEGFVVALQEVKPEIIYQRKQIVKKKTVIDNARSFINEYFCALCRLPYRWFSNKREESPDTKG